MDSDTLKRKVIEAGIQSVLATEDRECRRIGCLIGFEICRDLHTPEDFEQVLSERNDVEHQMRCDQVPPEEYWEYRCATAQIHHTFERLKVLWGGFEVYSGFAILHVNELLHAHDPA